MKFEVKEEDDDENKVTQVPICTQYVAEFKTKIALVKHRVEVHNKSLKIFEVCVKTCEVWLIIVRDSTRKLNVRSVSRSTQALVL